MRKVRILLYAFSIVMLSAIIQIICTEYSATSTLKELYDNKLFPPTITTYEIWIVVYFLYALSFYMSLQNAKDMQTIREANSLFISQLLLHNLWAFLFFYLGYCGIAVVAIIIIDLVVYKTIVFSAQIDKNAGRLIYPYFVWVYFITFLNIIFVHKNGFIVYF